MNPSDGFVKFSHKRLNALQIASAQNRVSTLEGGSLDQLLQPEEMKWARMYKNSLLHTIHYRFHGRPRYINATPFHQQNPLGAPSHPGVYRPFTKGSEFAKNVHLGEFKGSFSGRLFRVFFDGMITAEVHFEHFHALLTLFHHLKGKRRRIHPIHDSSRHETSATP